MFTADFLKNLFITMQPNNVGKYQHYNDTRMANTGPREEYRPPTAQTPYHEIPAPTEPSIIVIRERRSWLGNYWNGFFDGMLFTQPTERTIIINNTSNDSGSFHSNQRNQDNSNGKHSGLLASVIVFSALIATAGTGIAYSYSEFKKLGENLRANRKPLANMLKIGWGAFLGYAGVKMGVQLGTYYGPALFGSGALGPFVGGMLLGTTTLSGGIFAGKYFSRLLQYVRTRGKSTNTDPHTLLPSQAEELDNNYPVSPYYNESLANLRKGYLVAKLEIAKALKAPKAWMNTLEELIKQLKEGKLSQQLQDYFNDEFILIRNTWLEQKFAPQDRAIIEQDYKALALVTYQVNTLIEDLTHSHAQTQSPATQMSYTQQPFQAQHEVVFPEQMPSPVTVLQQHLQQQDEVISTPEQTVSSPVTQMTYMHDHFQEQEETRSFEQELSPFNWNSPLENPFSPSRDANSNWTSPKPTVH